MNAADAAGFGPWGGALAIAAMALATYLCRISGVLLMSRVRITPTIQRALGALPGSIIAATVVPIAILSGWDAIAGVLGGIVGMRVFRNEVLALGCGLALAAGIRALGLTP